MNRSRRVVLVSGGAGGVGDDAPPQERAQQWTWEAGALGRTEAARQRFRVRGAARTANACFSPAALGSRVSRRSVSVSSWC